MTEPLSRADRVRALVMHEHERLYAILDEDPARAITEARQLVPGPDFSPRNVEAVRASIFIDAGGQLSDAAVVSEGVDLLRQNNSVDTPQFAYNLGNGVAALARIQSDGSPGQLSTAALRQEARGLFQDAADNCEQPSIKSSSLTNLANLLKDSYRWVEAYDAYSGALQHDPANAIALSGISSLLRWRLRRRVDEDGPLRRAAVRYLLRARDAIDQARRYAGPQGVRRIEELIREFNIDADATPPEPETPPASPYAAFVRGHRLALCLEPESAGGDLGRWDHLAIPSVSESMNGEHRIPTIFASWNVLKSDFLTARWIAHVALTREIPDTGFYSDTLDYANYGCDSAGMVLAQKAAFDVLDKIAVAATDYLTLRGSPHKVYFSTRWHVLKKKSREFETPLQWQPEVRGEIDAGNRSLVALAELAHDYASGYLRSKKEARNSATHRLVVLHDMLIDGRSRPSDAIERYQHMHFERLVVESLQLARAALLYFHEVISARERRLRRQSSGRSVQMIVPSHHWVRGDAFYDDSDDGDDTME